MAKVTRRNRQAKEKQNRARQSNEQLSGQRGLSGAAPETTGLAEPQESWRSWLDRQNPWPRWSASLARLDRVIGPNALVWPALLLFAPPLMIWFTLTIGWRGHGLPLVDFDYWWHVATGEWILDHRQVPSVDPFSWTVAGTDWIPYGWLAEIILAVTTRVSGYAGAISLTAVITIAGYGFVVAAARFYGQSWRAMALLTLLWGGELIRPGVIVVRPQLWSFTLVAAVLMILAAYDTGRWRRLWVLPPLFALWINVNLSATIGIVCLGAFGLDRLVRRRLDRHLVVVSLLSVGALLVNPWGFRTLLVPLQYAERDAWRYRQILEWQSPDLSNPLMWWPFILTFPVAFLAGWHLLRLRIWPALPMLILFYQSFTAIRFIPIHVILAWVFAGWLVWQRAQDTDREPVVQPVVPRQPWLRALPLAATAVAILVVATVERSQLRWEPRAAGYPETAATYLLERYSDARLFNIYDYGGYLIYRFNEEQHVYVDGREEMYGEAFLDQYFGLIFGNPGWSDAFDRMGIDAALTRQIDDLDERLEDAPGWELVYGDEDSALYLRESYLAGLRPSDGREPGPSR